MIVYGKKEYIPQLKHLWIEVFGDSEEYVNAFFNDLYQEENVIVFVEKGEVLAALYMVPYQVCNQKSSIQGNAQLAAAEEIDEKAVYLYALATKKSARNRGIMAQLILESQKISTKRGYDYQFLIPSEVSIQTYYNQFGFKVCECVTTGMLCANDFKECEKPFEIYEEKLVNSGNYQNITAMRTELTNDEGEFSFFIEKVLM